MRSADIYPLVSISCKLALVSQDLELFSGSLRYNIEYGLKDCTLEKVIDAVKKAKADDFLSELMHQYDTGTHSSHLIPTDSLLAYRKCPGDGLLW